MRCFKKKLKFDHIYIWIRDEKNPDVLRLVTPDPEEAPRTIPLQLGIIGKTIREGTTICVPDINRNPDYRLVRVGNEIRTLRTFDLR